MMSLGGKELNSHAKMGVNGQCVHICVCMLGRVMIVYIWPCCRLVFLEAYRNLATGIIGRKCRVLIHIHVSYSLSSGKDHESVASIVTSAVGTGDNVAPDE